MNITRIEDVAEFIAGEAIELGIFGIEFGTEEGATGFVPNKWCACVAHVLGEGLHIPSGVDEFEDAAADEFDVLGCVGFGGKGRELFDDEKLKLLPPIFCFVT